MFKFWLLSWRTFSIDKIVHKVDHIFLECSLPSVRENGFQTFKKLISEFNHENKEIEINQPINTRLSHSEVPNDKISRCSNKQVDVWK